MKQTLLSRDINDLHSYLRWHSVSQFVEPGLTTLDIGCNIGTMTIEIAQQTSSGVVGIDVDERLVEHARDRAKRAGLSNVEFRCGSATALPFPDESFEQILLADVLEHVDDDHQVIAECFRVLKPGGRFILNLPRPNYSRLFNADWIRHIGYVRDGYELADISRLTAGMFRIEKFEFNSRAGEEFDAFYNKGRDRITEERLQMLFTLESDATKEAFGLTVVATRLGERVRGHTELPRVLHVSWGHPPNCAAGPIYYLQQLCLEQQAQGMHVACFVAGNEQGSPDKPPTIRREVHEGVVYAVVENRPAHYFDWAHPLREANNGAIEKLFEEMLDLWQPDIVHFHNLVGLSLSLPAIAKEFGAATILSAHNYWTICTRDDLFTPAEKVCAGPEDGSPCAACTGNPHLAEAYRMRTSRALRLLNVSLDLIIAVSSRVKELLRRAGVEGNKIIVQHIGSRAAEKNWETVGCRRKAEGGASRPVRFAFVGTMLPRKGPHVVIEAVKLLLDRKGEFVVSMYGGGLAASYKQRLDSLMASEPLLAECVRFKGGYFQHQLADLLGEMDVAIIPPVWEDNGPQTVMEALAAGVPVIGANIGGIPDFVHHGENGLLFTAGNPTELASAMRSLIDDPSRIDTLKSGIREPISMARHARELQETYAQILVPATGERHEKRAGRRRVERYADDALELLDLKRRYAELERRYRQLRQPENPAFPVQQSSERTLEAIVQEASRLVEAGKSDQAVACLEQGFAQFKGAAKLHFGLYELLNLQQRHAEAEWHFALAQACDPSLAEIHNEFGVRAYLNGDVKLALRNFERAVRLNRRCIAPLKNLAELYIQLERPSESIPLLRDVLSLAPDDVEAMRLLGHVCIRLNELGDALFFFEKSVELDPADETTKEIVAALRAKGVAPRVPAPAMGACLENAPPHSPILRWGGGPPSRQPVAKTPADYRRKLDAEIACYAEQANVHDLPPINHVMNERFLSSWLRILTGERDFMDWWAKEIRALAEACDGDVKILSVGCGNGDVELDLLSRIGNAGRVQLLGLDVNEAMIARGTRMAQERGVRNAAFAIQDLNDLKLHDTYDVIIASHSLHHIVELEKLFDEIARASSEDMIFLVNDMIGQNGHVMWPATHTVVKRVWDSLDRRFKFNAYWKAFDSEPINHDCSSEGFEGIRAQDILPLLLERFDVQTFLPFSGIANRFTDRGYGHNFKCDAPDDVALMERIFALDVRLLLEKKVSPVQVLMKLKKRGTVDMMNYLSQTPEETISLRTATIEEGEIEWNPHAAVEHRTPVLKTLQYEKKRTDYATAEV